MECPSNFKYCDNFNLFKSLKEGKNFVFESLR